MQTHTSAGEPADQSPLSLSRLREAFAQMLGSGRSGNSGEPADSDLPIRNESAGRKHDTIANAPCEINARSVAEAVLFVGRPDNSPISARELAGIMRGVSPAEIHSAVDELNAIYDADMTPYKIETTNLGHRLVLRPEYERMRDQFYGRVREAKLSAAALEVLSIVAYNQPLALEKINQMRGAPSGAVVSTLVRRQLLRLERAPAPGGVSRYWTTDRFLRLFGLVNLAALSRTNMAFVVTGEPT
jgi:segregation and condensation protein B